MIFTVNPANTRHSELSANPCSSKKCKNKKDSATLLILRSYTHNDVQPAIYIKKNMPRGRWKRPGETR